MFWIVISVIYIFFFGTNLLPKYSFYIKFLRLMSKLPCLQLFSYEESFIQNF